MIGFVVQSQMNNSNNCSFSESKPYTMISLVLLFQESVLWLIYFVKQNLCSLIFKQMYFIIQVLFVNQNHRAQPVKLEQMILMIQLFHFIISKL